MLEINHKVVKFYFHFQTTIYRFWSTTKRRSKILVMSMFAYVASILKKQFLAIISFSDYFGVYVAS